jgi:predicted transposase/invertase (TIGR01784 family)
MNELNQSHDRFFFDTFSRKEVAVDFLEHYLPPEISGLFDLSTLEISKDSFIDETLGKFFSDILYHLKLKDGKSSYIYLLFEHKSHPEPLISFQLLGYMLRIWQLARKQNQSFCPVFSVVFYHGTEKWKVGLDFKDLFIVPKKLEPYLPNFRYWLCDLSRYSDAEIKGQVMLRVTLLIYKNIFSDTFPERLPEIISLLKEMIRGKTGLAYVESLFRYIASAGRNVTEENFKQTISTAIPEGGIIMSTLAQKWYDEGKTKGIDEGKKLGIDEGKKLGILQGLYDYIELALEFRFGVEGLREFSNILKIKDIDVLRAIKNGVKMVKTPDELHQIYR